MNKSGGTIAIPETPITLGASVSRVGQGQGAVVLQYGPAATGYNNEIPGATELLTVTGAPTGGSITLNVTVNGMLQNTGPIAFNATAAQVQTALGALTNGGQNVLVTGLPGGPWTIDWEVAPTVVGIGVNSFTGGAAPSLTVGGLGFTTLTITDWGKLDLATNAANASFGPLNLFHGATFADVELAPTSTLNLGGNIDLVSPTPSRRRASKSTAARSPSTAPTATSRSAPAPPTRWVPTCSSIRSSPPRLSRPRRS